MSNGKMPLLVSAFTPFPYQIDYQATLESAGKLMKEHSIRHLIVTRDNDIYSLISRHDLARHAEFTDSENEQSLTVNDLCVERVVCADINDPLDKVLDGMADQQLGSVVVLREGELAGILTTTDACRVFAQFLRDTVYGKNPSGSPDIVA